MSLVSIVGRKLFAAPVPGDVELLQMCAAFASSAFFAYCHLANGDVKVDFFTHNLAPRTVARLDAIGSFLVGAFGALLAWRTAVGRAGGPRGRRDVGGAGHSHLDRAGADGARFRAARRRRVLHVRAPAAPFGKRTVGERRRAVPRRSLRPLGGSAAAAAASVEAVDDRHRNRARDLRRHAGADGRARSDRDRDVRRRLRRLPLSHRRQRRGTAQFAQESGVRPAVELRPRRDPAVPADGPVRHARRPLQGAVPLRRRLPRPSPWRRGDGGDRRLCRVRRDLRLVGGDRGDDGSGRAAGIAPLRLLRLARDRRAGRGRHARDHDSAVGAARDLRDPDAGIDRQAVHGRRAAGHHRDAGLHARGEDHRDGESARGSGRPARRVARASAVAAAGAAGAPRVRRRDRRHLRRLGESDRGGGDRRGGLRRHRRSSAAACARKGSSTARSGRRRLRR